MPEQIKFPFPDAVVSAPIRESGGAPSALGHEFHHIWALCRLLELHESDADYLLVVEFREDIMVMDPANEPTQADFIQAKSLGANHWTRTSLVSVGRGGTAGQPRSILGKLFHHTTQFPGHVRSLVVASNAQFNFPLAAEGTSGSMQRIPATMLAASERKALARAIQSELTLSDETPIELLVFETSPLSLHDLESGGMGKVTQFLEKHRPKTLRPAPVYRRLADLIRMHAISTWRPCSFDELCRKKSVRRADVDRILADAEVDFDITAVRSELNLDLCSNGVPDRQRGELLAGLVKYATERGSETDSQARQLRQRLEELMPDAVSSDWNKITELLALAYEAFTTKFGEPPNAINRNYLKGAILLEYKLYRHGTPQLPAPDPQPAKETA